ncbi:MAG: hypothetical protein AAF903_02255 [Pseudomonadota bacterium]
MCNKHNTTGRETKVSDLGLDQVEQLLLLTARQYFVSYTDPSHPHWETAFDICESQFGEETGSQIAAGVLGVLRKMRVSRRSTFHFTNPYCRQCAGRLSECECQLFSALRHMRNRDTQSAYDEAVLLCEGHQVEPMLRAMEKLCELLPNAAPSVPLTAPSTRSLH